MPSESHFATPVEFDSIEMEVEVYNHDDVVITAFAASHPPVEPAFAYKIEFAGKKVIVSGDTIITDELPGHSTSADLVLLDVLHYGFVSALENAFRSTGDDRMASGSSFRVLAGADPHRRRRYRCSSGRKPQLPAHYPEPGCALSTSIPDVWLVGAAWRVVQHRL